MLKRAWFRIQPIEQIRKRKRRKKEMWERSRRNLLMTMCGLEDGEVAENIYKKVPRWSRRLGME